jgi:hypothetical protein
MTPLTANVVPRSAEQLANTPPLSIGRYRDRSERHSGHTTDVDGAKHNVSHNRAVLLLQATMTTRRATMMMQRTTTTQLTTTTQPTTTTQLTTTTQPTTTTVRRAPTPTATA